jgi:outer membrane lipoprotein-sorting protein
MNLNHDHDSEFERRLRALPADDAPRAEHQAALREQALAQFAQALEPGRRPALGKRILLFGRNIMERPTPRYLVAASVVAALVWIFVPGGNSTARAFTQIVDAILEARSARFKTEVHVEMQPKQTFTTLFLAPAKYRMETGPSVIISDFEGGKMLNLVPDKKQAFVFNLKNAPKDKTTDSLFENLRRLLRQQRDNMKAYEKLGEKMIDGRKAVGFRLESGTATTTLWGDPKTGAPIRIENVYSGVPKTEAIMTNFEMNVPLQADLFALTIPKGYEVQSFDIDASKPEEKDLVESLRVCTGMSGGDFPDALDTQSVMKLMFNSVLKGKEGGQEKEKLTQQMITHSIKIGRGFSFALDLPASAKAHYAGKGVKKDTRDRPIFWYLPEGSQRYRVIDATLAVREAEAAPQIEGAVPLAKKTATDSPP